LRVTPSFLQNSLGGGSPPALHEKYKFPPGTTSVSPGIVRKNRFEYNAEIMEYFNVRNLGTKTEQIIS
jgi:hypothetical protein